MPRVAVVGAGVAGVEAATVAAINGARVVLLEAGDSIPAPKSSWAAILEAEGKRQFSRAEGSLASTGVEVQLGQKVSKLDGPEVSVAGRRSEFDSVVVATGSSPLPDRFDGSRKQGVHLLDSQASFSELGRKIGEYAKAVVSGSGPVALEVADRLRSRRLSVSILAPGGVLPMLNTAPRSVVGQALSEWGVPIIEGKLERAAGANRVEAIVASGDVVPCDCLVVVPRLIPSVPVIEVSLGRSGGLSVDQMMKTSSRSVYAAGDCAEVTVGRTTISVMFESSARLMGAVAGANASGKRASASIIGSFFMTLFGVGVASAGIGLGEALALGLEVSETSKTWKGELACSLVYERGTKAVVGAQLAGKGVDRLADSLPIIVASRITLDQLAYQEALPSSDISPIVETARGGSARQ